MEKWPNELSDILEKEESVLSEILNESRQKTEALRTADIPSLDGIVNREQALALQLQALESKREKFCKEHGLAGLTLSEIITRAGDDCRETLSGRLKVMSGLESELKRKNDLNSQLTQSRLTFYNFFFRNEKVYENDGRAKKSASGNALIDQRV